MTYFKMHDWYQMRAWTEKFNQDNDVAIDLSVRRAKSDDNQIYHNHSGSHVSLAISEYTPNVTKRSNQCYCCTMHFRQTIMD